MFRAYVTTALMGLFILVCRGETNEFREMEAPPEDPHNEVVLVVPDAVQRQPEQRMQQPLVEVADQQPQQAEQVEEADQPELIEEADEPEQDDQPEQPHQPNDRPEQAHEPHNGQQAQQPVQHPIHQAENDQQDQQEAPGPSRIRRIRTRGPKHVELSNNTAPFRRNHDADQICSHFVDRTRVETNVYHRQRTIICFTHASTCGGNLPDCPYRKCDQYRDLNHHIAMTANNSWIQEGDNTDLTMERRKATFRTEELSKFLCGGADKLRRRSQIAEYVDEHPDLHEPVPVAFLSRAERIENASRAMVAMRKHMDKVVDRNNIEEVMYFTELTTHMDGKPNNLHLAMFLPTLQTQTDDEQKSWWLKRAQNYEILGTYAQTELGHGTMLRKLETTATLDRATDSWIINSPTITASKWWPGNLGKVSNYCILAAQLYIDGKCYGPHTFMVQLRCENTHQPLPGITVGDIGPKFGINSVDNGFLRFDNVRIPRRHMMMGHAKVTKDGQYIKPIHAKLSYGAMVFVRSGMITQQAHFLALAATICTRYSAIRRQGLIDPTAVEVQILDYQTQQHRLFPQIARALAFMFTGEYVLKLYNKVVADLSSGNAELLPELHALTSGLKAVVTHQTGLGIEQCRMACGGHGYSEASGIPVIYTQAIGGATYEGENMVMLLQTARFLMKAATHVRKNERPKGASVKSQVDYLYVPGVRKCRLEDSITRNPHCPSDQLIECFEHVARRLTMRANDRLQSHKAGGTAAHRAWNECAVDLTKATRAHTKLFIARTFVETVEGINDSDVLDVMKDMLNLYLLYEMSEMSGHLLEDGFMTGTQMANVQCAVYSLLAKIRPNAVSIVDSFAFHDRQLKSVLGRRDGHVYENMLKFAQNSELNKTEVISAYHKYLGPMMRDAKSKL